MTPNCPNCPVQKSEEQLAKAIAIKSKVLGVDHPVTIESRMLQAEIQISVVGGAGCGCCAVLSVLSSVMVQAACLVVTPPTHPDAHTHPLQESSPLPWTPHTHLLPPHPLPPTPCRPPISSASPTQQPRTSGLPRTSTWRPRAPCTPSSSPGCVPMAQSTP